MTVRNRFLCGRRRFLVTFLSIFGSAAHPLQAREGGTSIGGGGDPFYFFLEVTRRHLIDTVDILRKRPAESIEELCNDPAVREFGRKDCQTFLAATVDQYSALNRGDQKIKFVVTTDQLFVQGPNGNPQEVVARTIYGPNGDIEFNRDLLSRQLTPSLVFMLMVHEFGHKVNYGSAIVRDNDLMGYYQTGREFLDELGAAFAHFAEKKGIIGKDFGIEDIFKCLVYGNGQFPSQHFFSGRRAYHGESLSSYHAGFGRIGEPTDAVLLTLNGDISLRVDIYDVASCVDSTEANLARRTTFSVIRTKVVDGKLDAETLVMRDFEGFSPLCDVSRTPLILAWDRFEFHCSYSRTNGVTRGPIFIK